MTKKDEVYDASHPLFAKARELLLGINKNKKYLSNFGAVYVNGTTVSATARACYASLDTMLDGKPVAYFMDAPTQCERHQDWQITVKEKLAYIQWLVTKSHWKDVYLMKDPEEILKLGCIFFTDCDVKWTIQAAIAMRYLGERTATISSWFRMKEFMDPHLALLFGHGFTLSGVKRQFLNTKLHPLDNHSIFSTNSIYQTDLPFFVAGRTGEGRLDPYLSMLTGYRCYYGQDSIWKHTKEGPALVYRLIDNNKPSKIKREERPFVGRVEETSYHSIADMDKICAELLKENGVK